VSFAYQKKPVLKKVDLKVGEGEAVVLMGRNGTGKTTLLRCLVGLLQVQSGQVEIAGRSIKGRHVADICRDVAYLPQLSDDLLFAETVYEELAFTLQNHGMDGAAQAIEQLLEQLDLSTCRGAYPRDLSAGERQRVALGAVTVTRPSLLLLDEPTRGMDYDAKGGLVALWKRLRQTGMGMLMVTHDVELAAQVADRVLILSEGEIIAAGSPQEVLGSSPLFAPQIARLFPGRGWLTVEDALEGIRGADRGRVAASGFAG
jgi:energy-coupling factor transport system ATP-binding protein